MSHPHSRYVEKPARRAAAGVVAARQVAARQRESTAAHEDSPERATALVPYLSKRVGVPFRGRVLEIGAGVAWFSAELSKLPGVVEIIATDVTGRRLKEGAPGVFRRLGAIESKITRMTGDLHKLEFPENHFDFVVCAAVLNRTVNIVEVLREAKRVLKPGGYFVAVREPVRPWLKFKSARAAAGKTRNGRLLYTLDEYERFFTAAGLVPEFKRVNLGSGAKYYFDRMFNGLTHARYALIARKPARPGTSRPDSKRVGPRSAPR